MISFTLPSSDCGSCPWLVKIIWFRFLRFKPLVNPALKQILMDNVKQRWDLEEGKESPYFRDGTREAVCFTSVLNKGWRLVVEKEVDLILCGLIACHEGRELEVEVRAHKILWSIGALCPEYTIGFNIPIEGKVHFHHVYPTNLVWWNIYVCISIAPVLSVFVDSCCWKFHLNRCHTLDIWDITDGID